MPTSPSRRLDSALERALSTLKPSGLRVPERFVLAVHDAVFPGGGRLRPALTAAVASACGREIDDAVATVGAAIELVHCASLVHDDLPCFDDAPTRRGRPSLHAAYDEPTAVLVGDELIVLAFDLLASEVVPVGLTRPLVRCLARGLGGPSGLIAGQAWEGESDVPATLYRRAKTAALFEVAAVSGALLATEDAERAEHWRPFAVRIGEAYQIADDLLDVLGDPTKMGKPVGNDARRGRPNAAQQWGASGAFEALQARMDAARSVMPACEAPAAVEEWLDGLAGALRKALSPAEERRGGEVVRKAPMATSAAVA